MANSDKNILITPNRGVANDPPKITLTGFDNQPIDLKVTDNNRLSFENGNNILFTVDRSTTGTVFQAGDVSGVPHIYALDTGEVGIAAFYGSVKIATSTLTAGSDVTIGGTVDFTGAVSFGGNLGFDGNIVRGNIRTADIFIRGTGLNNNANREVRINGGPNIAANSRGYRLIILNKQNLAVVSNNTYDTYGSSAASNNMATALNNMTQSQLGIITSYDAIESNYTNSLRQAFMRLGLSKAAYITGAAGIRQAYCAIFHGGNGTDGAQQAIEVHQGNDSNSPHATLLTRVWCRDAENDSEDGGFDGNGITNALYSTRPDSIAPAIYVDTNNRVAITGGRNDMYSATTILDLRSTYNSSSATDVRENIANAGIAITVDRSNNTYTPGLFWRTNNDQTSKPKAGIWVRHSSRGTSELHFGASSLHSNGLRVATYDETKQETFINPLGNLNNASYIVRSSHFEEPDEMQNSSATGRWVALEGGTVYVGHLGRGTKVYRKRRSNGSLDQVINATGNPGYNTFSVSTGDEFWANAPVGYYCQGAQEDIVPMAYNGMNFGYWTQRYYTGRVKIYSPGGSTVSFYENSTSALSGSAAHTANIGPGDVLDWAIDDTTGYHMVRVTGGSPVVMTKRGTSGDRSIIPPMSRHIVMPYGGNVANATVTTSSSLERAQNLSGATQSSAYRNGGNNRYTFWHEEYPMWGEQLADAAGGDMDMHIPFCMLSNYYIVPRGPLPYNAVFVYPNSRFQIWYWSGSSWGLHRSVTIDGDPFAGTGYGEGRQYNYSNIGPGTDTVAVYSCNKPFALRLNDRSSDEFVFQGHHMRNPMWMGLPVR